MSESHKPRILVVHGHPLRESFCTAVGKAYAEGARGAGAEVHEVFVHELEFDPVLHRAYLAIQQLEPDLLHAQAEVKWAEHLVFAFPIWWGVPPAKMIGMFDRAFHPSWAFKYEGTAAFPKRLLKGRSARLIATMDSPPWYFRWLMGQPGMNMMRRSLLEFCGIRPVRCTSIGSVRFSTPARRERWLREARELGTKCR